MGKGYSFAVAYVCDMTDEPSFLVGDPYLYRRNLRVIGYVAGLCT